MRDGNVQKGIQENYKECKEKLSEGFEVKKKKEKLMQRRRETKTLNGSENFISAKSKSKMSSVPAMEPALYK